MKIRFNLLPPKQKKHLRMQKVFRTIVEQEIQIAVLLVFVVISFTGMFLVLRTETSIMQEVSENVKQEESYKKVATMYDRFANVHDKLDDVEKLTQGHIVWSKILILFSENIPDSIIVNSTSTSNTTIVMNAVGDTREDVVSLKETFEEITHNDVKCFENVAVPEAQLAVPRNVKFTMSFKVNLECLK
ncbi:MAG: hypothetical protein ABFQ53_02475 [Patescibacteria group bacterium]